MRLYADSPIEDLKLEEQKPIEKNDIAKDIKNEMKQDRSDYFFLPGKVLHIDGDQDFLNRCLDFYKEAGVYAVGKRYPKKIFMNRYQLF